MSTSQVETRPCTIFWVCPQKRLFGCEYGVFEWLPCHEESLAKFCPGLDFAEILSKVKSNARMSQDGTTLQMIQFGDEKLFGMAFEVIQQSFYGSVTAASGLRLDEGVVMDKGVENMKVDEAGPLLSHPPQPCKSPIPWSKKLKRDLEYRHHLYGDIMSVVRGSCHDIMALHKGRQTEHFYEKMLSTYLYEKGIPYMTQVDCFIQHNSTQVHVGRLDMEIAHNTILELKSAQAVTAGDEAQLMRYVRAKLACGMKLEYAAVVCFCYDGTVTVLELVFGGGGKITRNEYFDV
jgi:GxxExxY protein